MHGARRLFSFRTATVLQCQFFDTDNYFTVVTKVNLTQSTVTGDGGFHPHQTSLLPLRQYATLSQAQRFTVFSAAISSDKTRCARPILNKNKNTAIHTAANAANTHVMI